MSKVELDAVLEVISSCKAVVPMTYTRLYSELQNAVLDAVAVKIKELDKQDNVPKQGDKVWGNKASGKWIPCVFICCYQDGFLADMDDKTNCGFEWFAEITTTDPSVLKYELTAQEAFVAVGLGKIVEEGITGKRLKYSEGYPTFIGEIVATGLFRGSLTCRCMYAIVEE